MKIIFVNEILAGGGKERRLIQTARTLANNDEDLQIHIVLEKNIIEYPEILLDKKVQMHILSPGNNWHILKEYIKVLNKIRPDIVQCWSEKSAFYFACFSFFYNYSFITSFIADCLYKQTFLKSIIKRFVYYRSKKNIGNSKAGIENYKAPLNKSFVIYNTYDPERLNIIKDKDLLKTELDITTQYIVLMVGGVNKFKDHRTFLLTAQNVLKKRKDITFIAAGKGCYLEQYQKETENEPNIKFLGFRNDVDSLINMSDICLLCTFSEGISNFLIESMMQKKVVIATGSGGTKEIVINNKTGFLYKNPTIEDITNKILDLINDKEEYNRISIEGYNYIKEKTSVQNAINKYFSLYKSIAN